MYIYLDNIQTKTFAYLNVKEFIHLN